MATNRPTVITVTAQRVIDADRMTVFTTTTDHRNYPYFLRRVGSIPGVARATIAGSGTIETGAHRKVWTTDGARLDETIAVHQPGVRHIYHWRRRGGRQPFAWLVRAGRGRWEFADEGDGTRVTWSYRFELTAPLARPVAALIAAGPFRWWMRTGLRRAAAMIADAPAAPAPTAVSPPALMLVPADPFGPGEIDAPPLAA